MSIFAKSNLATSLPRRGSNYDIIPSLYNFAKKALTDILSSRTVLYTTKPVLSYNDNPFCSHTGDQSNCNGIISWILILTTETTLNLANMQYT